jgi:sirohydrochlorin cobaltochelatase
MICGHGSRNKGAVKQFAQLAEGLTARFPDWPVEYGYLEFANPVIHDGLNRLREQGCTRVLAVPGMLFAAGHAKNDIPSVLNTYQAMHPEMTISYGRELAVDTRMVKAAAARIQEAIDAADSEVPLHETLLMVVGRGASDPDANSNVAKITRMLWEGFGFGWAETCYSGVTFPLVGPGSGTRGQARLPARDRVPYFLFTGVLVQRIYSTTDEVAAKHPEIEFLKAGYLNDHPQVIDTMADRVQEILQGANLMNCQMCKYREQVLGFEAEVGLAQESHHHHVDHAFGGAGRSLGRADGGRRDCHRQCADGAVPSARADRCRRAQARGHNRNSCGIRRCRGKQGGAGLRSSRCRVPDGEGSSWRQRARQRGRERGCRGARRSWLTMPPPKRPG